MPIRSFAIVIVMCLVGALPRVSRGDDRPPAIKLKKVMDHLDHPVDLQHDSRNRIFILEQPGRVRLVVDGKLDQAPGFLDITKMVDYQGEKGLLGIALHPKFSTNGLFYLDYTGTENRQLKTYIVEYHADPKSDHADPGSRRVILTIDQPQPNHNGGQIQFGPDGMLYIAMGDGGAGGDSAGGHHEPGGNAQFSGTLLGKILRIDINKRDGDKQYAIPTDNPFVGDEKFRPEIYAWGLRNPWRFSFDRKTGEMYAGDVGQNKYEEIDYITKGGNYGWRIREGLHPHNERDKKPEAELIDPIKEYDRSLGLCVTGGYVYRGKKIPQLQGWYIYGDFGSGRVFALKTKDGKLIADAELLGQSNAQPSSFGEDLDGEIYLVNHGGAIFQIVPANSN